MRLIPVFLAACGDPLLDDTYRGEPIYVFEGSIVAPDQLDGLELGVDVKAAFFWSPNLSPFEEPDLVEQTSVTAEVRFPATFEVRVFEPPAEEHFVAFDKRYALASLLIYADVDADGRFGLLDRIVGGTFEKAILFAREEVPADQSPTANDVHVGFTIVQTPLECPEAALEGFLDPRMTPESLDECRYCGEGTYCNIFGFCEPEYPLVITVTEELGFRELFCVPVQ
jgi:hypothetical protein